MVLGWIEKVWGKEIADDLAKYMEWSRKGREEDEWAEVWGIENVGLEDKEEKEVEVKG